MKIQEFAELTPERQQIVKHDSLLRNAAMLMVLEKSVKKMVERQDELGLMLLNAGAVNIIAKGMIQLGLIVEQPGEDVTIQ